MNHGEYVVDSLFSQGFIHMSKEEQVLQVAHSIFKNAEDLVLLYIDSERIKENLKWEGKEEYGVDFPHLYNALPLDAVQRVEEFTTDKDGNYFMP